MKPLTDHYIRYELFCRTEHGEEQISAGMHPVKTVNPDIVEDVVRGVFRLHRKYNPKPTERPDRWEDGALVMTVGVLAPANDLLASKANVPTNDLPVFAAKNGADYDEQVSLYHQDPDATYLFELEARDEDGEPVDQLIRELRRYDAYSHLRDVRDLIPLLDVSRDRHLGVTMLRQAARGATLFTVFAQSQ